MKTTIRSVNSPLLLGHRVIAMPAPGVAAAKALQCQPAALQRTVLLYSLHTISTTGRCVAATRPQERRYGQLVKAYEPRKQYGQQFLHPVVIGSVVDDDGGGVNWRSSLSVAVVMACSTVAYSGSAASVNSTKTCSCIPAGTTGGSRCLR